MCELLSTLKTDEICGGEKVVPPHIQILGLTLSWSRPDPLQDFMKTKGLLSRAMEGPSGSVGMRSVGVSHLFLGTTLWAAGLGRGEMLDKMMKCGKWLH